MSSICMKGKKLIRLQLSNLMANNDKKVKELEKEKTIKGKKSLHYWKINYFHIDSIISP